MMDELTTEIAENVIKIEVCDIESVPPVLTPLPHEQRTCAGCGMEFSVLAQSSRHYCEACAKARRIEAGRKGGKALREKYKKVETTEKENQNMPISNTLPELHKCAVCGNDFLTTKNEPMCVQCRAEYAPAQPVETCLIGKPAYHVVVREPAPVATVAEPKPTSKAAQTMRRIFDAVETVERIANEWGVDADTVIDTITEAFGLARTVENRKSRCAKEGI